MAYRNLQIHRQAILKKEPGYGPTGLFLLKLFSWSLVTDSILYGIGLVDLYNIPFRINSSALPSSTHRILFRRRMLFVRRHCIGGSIG
jgi:hypothetical protein